MILYIAVVDYEVLGSKNEGLYLDEARALSHQFDNRGDTQRIEKWKFNRNGYAQILSWDILGPLRARAGKALARALKKLGHVCKKPTTKKTKQAVKPRGTPCLLYSTRTRSPSGRTKRTRR